MQSLKTVLENPQNKGVKDIEISILDVSSTDYPLLLKELRDHPNKLYIKHKKNSFDPSIFNKCLSVVGSRKMTDYGKRVTQYFVSSLCNSGICIVSGFMYGIDAQAHISALSVGGKTIAVMPCGHDFICPDFQNKLYYEIIENGGIILTEYEPDIAPKTWTFPRRNRLVAALSLVTLVVEAGEHSGSLITADYAKKLGRKVFAVPGEIFNPAIRGNWQLISDGANVAYSDFSIREKYSGSFFTHSNMPNIPGHKNECEHEHEILRLLKKSPSSMDEIHANLGIPITQIMTLLTSLTIKGLIYQKGGKYYAC